MPRSESEYSLPLNEVWPSDTHGPHPPLPRHHQGDRLLREDPPDIVHELEDLTPKFELQDLVESAHHSYRLFASFYQATASSNHPSVVAIVEDIKTQFGGYCGAIDESIVTAQNGYTFAMDGVDLCDFIGQARPLGEITSFIGEMLASARESHAKAVLTSAKFRSIRAALSEIAESIPWHVAVYNEHDDEASHHAKKRSKESFADILARLSRDINNLGEHVSDFANWWIETETKLDSILSKIRRLDAQRVDGLRLRTVRSGWVDVRERYLGYKRKIAKLQDSALMHSYSAFQTEPNPRTSSPSSTRPPSPTTTDMPSLTTTRPPSPVPSSSATDRPRRSGKRQRTPRATPKPKKQLADRCSIQ